VHELFRGSVGRRVLTVVATDAADGDMRPSGPLGRQSQIGRQRALTGAVWMMVDEVHGVEVFDADAAPPRPTADAGELPTADVIVTSAVDAQLAIWAGDCAPVVLCGDEGTLVAAHAGWKGLAAGVLDVAVGLVVDRGDRVGAAVLGPCIRAECYEFGPAELRAVAAGVAGEGDPDAALASITATTLAGRPAFDLPAAVAWALRRHHVELDTVRACTACDPRWFSHRARADVGRHAVVAWTSPRHPGREGE
jgi:polyphenol oxidase